MLFCACENLKITAIGTAHSSIWGFGGGADFLNIEIFCYTYTAAST